MSEEEEASAIDLVLAIANIDPDKYYLKAVSEKCGRQVKFVVTPKPAPLYNTLVCHWCSSEMTVGTKSGHIRDRNATSFVKTHTKIHHDAIRARAKEIALREANEKEEEKHE